MKTALYAGSFDPITRGHLSVVRRGAAMFDRLVVVVAKSPNKTPMFSMEERVSMIEAANLWPNVRCIATTGYVVHLAQELGAKFLVRGVRGITDIDDELRLARANAEIAPDVTTVFVPAERILSRVSSTELKRRAALGDDLGEFCTPAVAQALRARIQVERQHV